MGREMVIDYETVEKRREVITCDNVDCCVEIEPEDVQYYSHSGNADPRKGNAQVDDVKELCPHCSGEDIIIKKKEEVAKVQRWRDAFSKGVAGIGSLMYTKALVLLVFLLAPSTWILAWFIGGNFWPFVGDLGFVVWGVVGVILTFLNLVVLGIAVPE